MNALHRRIVFPHRSAGLFYFDFKIKGIKVLFVITYALMCSLFDAKGLKEILIMHLKGLQKFLDIKKI